VDLLAQKLGGPADLLHPGEVRSQVHLPLRGGGLGLRAASIVAPVAFISGVARSAGYLHPLPVGLTIAGIRDAYSAFGDHELKLPLLPRLPDQLVPTFAAKAEDKENKDIDRLQHRLTEALDNDLSRRNLDDASELRYSPSLCCPLSPHRARSHSLTGSSLWLCVCGLVSSPILACQSYVSAQCP